MTIFEDHPPVRPRRPKGVLGVGLACIRCAATGCTEHAPPGAVYPDTVVKRVAFEAGGGLGWRISALVTPRRRPAPWKIVVITGAPSWAEYWAPVMADLPEDREMIVVDRPGYAASEPAQAVCDIRVQARALAPALATVPGQKVMLVGQSYGAAIAAMMAAEHPGRVASLMLLSTYFGEPGPTARWLVDAGATLMMAIPRDLRNAVQEVRAQPAQLDTVRRALRGLTVPVHIVHGDHDDFAPLDVAERLAGEGLGAGSARFERVAGAGHFLNDESADILLAAIERCIPPAEPAAASSVSSVLQKAAHAGQRLVEEWRHLSGLPPLVPGH